MLWIMARGLAASLVLFVVTAFDGLPGAQAQGDIGVILMHGKQSTPSGLESMAAQLRSKGMKVVNPQMPWSRGQWERISVTVEAVHTQIDGMAAQLRAQGARRIVVGGHSIGANVALSYAAVRGNVAGVILIGPGHGPAYSFRTMSDFRAAVERAAGLVKSGQGAQPLTGPDNNQGRTFSVSTTAEVYVSWMSPQGLGNMMAQAPRIAPRIPVLMVIGSQDTSFGIAQSAIYQPAAKHAYSKYFAIQGGDHVSVLGTAGNFVAEWLQGLPAQGAAPARESEPAGPQAISQTCQRFEGSWTSRGPSGTLVLARSGRTWTSAGTGSANMSMEPRPVQSVQRTGNRVEVVTATGARLHLEEAGRRLTGQLVSPAGGAAQVELNCVR